MSDNLISFMGVVMTSKITKVRNLDDQAKIKQSAESMTNSARTVSSTFLNIFNFNSFVGNSTEDFLNTFVKG